MKKKILVLILILATVFRLIGLYPGYHPNHSDEVNIYSQAVNILKTGSLEELRFEYPPIPAYINFLSFKFVFVPLSWGDYYFQNLGQVFDGTLPLALTADASKIILQVKILGDRDINAMFWSRTITGIISIGIVFLIYKIGKDLFDENTGLIAAFLTAINYRQVLNSHFGLPDIYNAFFLALAFYVTLRVWKRPILKNYILAAIASGISFSTKYQFFAFLPLLIVHLYRVLEEKDLRKKITILFDPSAILVPFIIAFVFLFFNPYFFINFQTAKDQLAYAALKYRFGKNFFDFYPLSYLYSYGIGKLTSILILIGIPFLVLKSFKKSILVLSIIVPIFYYLVFMTGGGFYTRNFISVTPFLLLFPGYLLSNILRLKLKYFGLIIFSLLIIFTGYENIKNDYILLSNYVKPWNQDVMETWIQNNLPNDSKIAAHSSVPLPDTFTSRLSYDTYPAFSIDEFKEEGADYAISNYEWSTNDFYWWMTQNTIQSLRYWNKPVEILKNTYSGLALSEMEDFGIYSIVKPALAPDANFLVARIPDYKVIDKKLIMDFNFKDGDRGWEKTGSTSIWQDGTLAIKMGAGDPYSRWISPKILISSEGFSIDYKIKTDENLDKREGFIFVKFYKGEKEIGVRLSKRNDIYNKWIDGSVSGEVPPGTDSIRVGLEVFNSALSNVYLSDIKIYSAIVKNKNSVGVHHIDVDPDVVFPISQGNM